MSWFEQVRHIVRKDLHEARWSLLGYSVLVSLVSITIESVSGSGIPQLPIIILIVGAIIVASQVQSDSPTRQDAFWASRPFDTGAMITAKLVLAVAIALIPLIAQFLRVWSFDVGMRAALGIVGQSAVGFTGWLLAAMVVAGLTRGIRTFVSASVAILVGIVVVIEVLFRLSVWFMKPGQLALLPRLFLLEIGHTAQLALLCLASIGAIAILIFIYRTRDTSRKVWIGAFVLAACLQRVTISEAVGPSPEAPAAMRTGRLQAQFRGPTVVEIGGTVQLTVSLLDPVSSSYRQAFVNDTLILHLRDSSTIRLRNDFIGIPLFDPPVSMIAGNSRPGTTEYIQRHSYTLTLDDEQARALTRGVTSAELVGRVMIMEPQIVGKLPVRVGASLARNGIRASIADVALAPTGGSIRLLAATIRLPADRLLSGANGLKEPTVALIDPVSGNTARFAGRDTRDTQRWLVLPMLSTMTYSSTSELSSEGAKDFGADRFAESELMIIKWIPRGSYPVRTEVPLLED